MVRWESLGWKDEGSRHWLVGVCPGLEGEWPLPIRSLPSSPRVGVRLGLVRAQLTSVTRNFWSSGQAVECALACWSSERLSRDEAFLQCPVCVLACCLGGVRVALCPLALFQEKKKTEPCPGSMLVSWDPVSLCSALCRCSRESAWATTCGSSTSCGGPSAWSTSSRTSGRGTCATPSSWETCQVTARPWRPKPL